MSAAEEKFSTLAVESLRRLADRLEMREVRFTNFMWNRDYERIENEDDKPDDFKPGKTTLTMSFEEIEPGRGDGCEGCGAFMVRPTHQAAERSIKTFLVETLGKEISFHLIEDGDFCWAFWIDPDDTTSYVHADLSIEWHGTTEETSDDQ